MKNWLINKTSGGSILIFSIFIVNVLNFVFNSYLGRVLTFQAYGLVAFINTMWYVMIIFLTALYVTVNQRSAYLIAQKGIQAGADFLNQTSKKILIITLIISGIWIAAIPLTNKFFQINDFLIPLLFTPVISLGAIVAANKGFLQGNFNFLSVAVIIILEALSKLIFAWFFVTANLHNWVYASIPLSVAVSFILAVFFTTRKIGFKKHSEKYSFPKRFFTATLITGFASMAFLTFDILLAKHYLTPAAAGQYALLSLVGKMVYFFGSLPSALIITFVSNDRGKEKNPLQSFNKLFSITIILTASAFILLGIFGQSIVPYLLGQKTIVILPYLMTYSVAIAFFVLSGSLISYHLAKEQYFFPLLAIIMAFLMSLGIVLSHKSIQDFTSVLLSISVLSFITVSLCHVLEVKKIPIVMKYMKAI